MISQKARHAIYIGVLCSVSYFAVYVTRNVLSAVTPAMVEAGFSEAYIGSVSSLYFVFYACGQLINGAIGDKIHAKWMISVGLLGAAITNFTFSRITSVPFVAMLVYALMGLFLSMIFGPMTKLVSENTELVYATRCSLGYTFASFFGSPAAGFLASFLAWQGVFAVSSCVLFTMATVGFVVFSLFERRGIIKYGQYKQKEKGTGTVRMLFRRQIIKFSMIALITGIVRTSVVFWLPTYISQYLGYTPQTSAAIFTGATFAISFTAFISVFVYERLGRNMNKTILIMFSSSAVFFALTFFVSHPVVNIVVIVLSIMSSNGASTMMYSRYCPSLRDTGMVSSITGFLDALSYLAAAIANLVFANAATAIGWGNLILVWLALVSCGILVALPYDRFRKAKSE